ncbi:unnamed protein product [Lathyrus oleraceus]
MEGMKVEVQRWLVEAVVDSVESSVKNSVMGFAAHLFLKAVEKVSCSCVAMQLCLIAAVSARTVLSSPIRDWLCSVLVASGFHCSLHFRLEAC